VIAAQTRATSQAAGTVSTPACERVILAALRSQLASATDVPNIAQQRAAGLVGQIRGLRYPLHDGRKGGHGDTQALGLGFRRSLLVGFDNPALVRAVTTLLGCPYTSRPATYGLRRLKRKGLIVRLSGHHRYQLTPLGRRVAVLFTTVYGGVLAPGLAE
jgi:hypothetical protein